MLDPRRIGLNAADIGFQKRLHQDLDFGAIQVALQTDYNNQGSAVQVRRERDAAKDEIHIMGGELAGFQSNDLIKTLARQERQINGYPLRHFDAKNPAVILPMKYGGFPLYNRNQTEYPEYVSVFTEPMSAPLQRDTELLSRMGKVPISHSLTRPFEEDGYMNPMTKSHAQLQDNQSEFIQRRHLQKMSDRSRMQKVNVPGGEKGIFINPNGDPVSTVQEQLSGQIVANNTFANAQLNFHTRASALQNPNMIGEQDFNLLLNAGSGSLVQEGNGDIASLRMRDDGRRPSTVKRMHQRFRDIEEDNTAYISENAYDIGDRSLQEQVAISNPNWLNNPTPSTKNGGQAMPLIERKDSALATRTRPAAGRPSPGTFGLNPIPTTPLDKNGNRIKGAVRKRWLKSAKSEEYRAHQRINMRLNFNNLTPAAKTPKRAAPGSTTSSIDLR